MKEIKLISRGKEFYTKVDDDMYDALSSRRWRVHYNNGKYYSVEGYSPKMSLMHRIITNCPNGMVVDHINGDTLDNRSCNIRVCTQRENAQNRGIQKNNKSGLIGVRKEGSRWIASAKVDYKAKWIGSFQTKKEAAIAYNNFIKESRGEYANLNII